MVRPLSAPLSGALIFFVLSCAVLRARGDDKGPRGIFDGAEDIGQPKIGGSTAYDAQKQEYVLTGAGTNMWGDRDEFQFAWKRLKGDFIVTARGRFLTEGGEPHKKFGWTARASLGANAANVSTPLHGEGLADLLFRRSAGAKTEEKKFELKKADVVQLERRGNTYIMSVARFGEPFVTQQIDDIDLGDEPYVGLFVCAIRRRMSTRWRLITCGSRFRRKTVLCRTRITLGVIWNSWTLKVGGAKLYVT